MPSSPAVASSHPLSVDPAVLGASALSLGQHAAALQGAVPAFTAAWSAAAHALFAAQTGPVMASSRSHAVAGLAGCADSVEALGQTLARAAGVYSSAEARAAGPVPAAH